MSIETLTGDECAGLMPTAPAEQAAPARLALSQYLENERNPHLVS